MDALSKIFKGLIWDLLISALLKKIFAALPILGWGPIGWLVTFIVGKLADALFEVLAEFVNFQVIVLRKEALAKEYAVQSYNLKQLADSKGIDSDEFKAQREKAKAALAQFVKFGD